MAQRLFTAGLSLLLLLPNFCLGQSQLLITANYDNIPFPKIVEDLEKRYPMHFYYAPEWVDSLSLSLAVQEQSLANFLDQLFANTDLHFYLTENQEIVLSQGFEIIPLPAKPFFAGEKIAGEADLELDIFKPAAEEIDETDPKAIEKILHPIGDPQKRSQGPTATIVGYLRDTKTGDALVGASVFKQNPVQGTLTDAFGYYVLTLPKGEYELFYRASGMAETKRRVEISGDGRLDVDLREKIVSLKEVQITSERSQVESVQTGVARLDLNAIKNTPTVLGEADVMKLALTLPGVQTIGEGASGFNVRGGSVDQNLITLDDGVIYNPSHLFGFFSAFNPEVIKSAELYKSGLQAQYGGRISSIFDVSIRDGNKKRFIAKGGISPLTSKFHVEGPLKQDTSSFILGLRSTYSNWLLNLLDDPTLNNSNAWFADGVAKVSHQVNDRNSLSLSLYHSRDRFRLNADTLFQYTNSNASLRFRHLFSNTFSGLFSASYTDYQYQISSTDSPVNSFDLDYAIGQYSLKADFDYFPQARHHVRFGGQVVRYDLSPGSIIPSNEATVFQPISLMDEQGYESALYLGDEWEVNSRLSLYGGLRLSMFNLLGSARQFNYAAGLPREPEFITDTTFYQAGELVKTYAGPELRFSSRFKINSELSAKMSYDRTRQYIHMLTNTVAISPTDTWRLSNPYLPPQLGDQVALGLYQSIPQRGLEVSLEAYVKRLQNLLEYKEGADLLVNEVLETDVLNASGLNYGVEFLFQKKSGKLTGWLSYTWSRALVRTNSPFAAEQINNGDWYPSNFDQPHKLVIISNYKFSRRFNLSFNLSYNTGRPTTLPIAQYQLNGAILPFFTERNQYRIPDYFRLDLGLNIEGNHKVDKLLHSSASFSIYNLTGRNNAYSVFSRINQGQIQTYQLSVFTQGHTDPHLYI
jgi:hypothetical protein